MAKKQPVQNKLVTLASSIADVLRVRESGGDLAVQICTACRRTFNDAPIPDEDRVFLLDEITRTMAWRESSARVRRAETDAILKAYAKLPDAIERARVHKSKGKPVPFSDAVKLSRLINRGNSAIQAAAAFLSGAASNKASEPNTRTKAEAIKSIKGHVKRIMQFTQALTKAQRAELLTWAQDVGVEL